MKYRRSGGTVPLILSFDNRWRLVVKFTPPPATGCSLIFLSVGNSPNQTYAASLLRYPLHTQLDISPSQRPLPTQHTQKPRERTFMPSARFPIPSNGAAADLHLSPHGHRDRPIAGNYSSSSSSSNSTQSFHQGTSCSDGLAFKFPSKAFKFHSVSQGKRSDSRTVILSVALHDALLPVHQ
jgi:hypothetical protein